MVASQRVMVSRVTASSDVAGSNCHTPLAQGFLCSSELLCSTLCCSRTPLRMRLGLPYVPLRRPYQLLPILLVLGSLYGHQTLILPS